MTLYDQFVDEVRSRALIAGSNAGRTGSLVTTRSTLVLDLERETRNPLRYIHPKNFEEYLRRSMNKPRETYEERCREAERHKSRREELLRVIAECEAVFLSATAFTPVETVASAHSRLASARYLLGLIPQDIESEQGIEPEDDSPLRSGEKIRAGFVSCLETWRARLDVELQRLRGKIEEKGEPPNSSNSSLLEDLAAVLRAIRDADDCLSIARRAQVKEQPPAVLREVMAARRSPQPRLKTAAPPTRRYRKAGEGRRDG